MKPLATRRALYLSISPFALCLSLKTHLLEIVFLPSGKSHNDTFSIKYVYSLYAIFVPLSSLVQSSSISTSSAEPSSDGHIWIKAKDYFLSTYFLLRDEAWEKEPIYCATTGLNAFELGNDDSSLKDGKQAIDTSEYNDSGIDTKLLILIQKTKNCNNTNNNNSNEGSSSNILKDIHVNRNDGHYKKTKKQKGT